ncbi:MAG: hypothetical protein OEU54_04725 [Gemmatimonadota bacterium]|nr:hypothetical protein [Gemmatimonadota bacterium]
MPKATSVFRLPSLFAVLLLAGTLAAPARAQSVSEMAAEAASSLEFREIGPAIMGGRVADLAVVESDPRIFYVGLGAGGVWKTENDGMTWDPIFDDQPTASIGAVSVAPSNPNVVWVGTGEPQNRQSSPWGIGVFRSTDAGRTWTHMGLEDTRHIARIKIDPRNPDVVFVGAVGHLWGPNAERGVFRTTDGGQSWENVLYIDEHTGVIDLVMDHNDPNTLFAATYQRQRTGFGFAAGGGGSGIWRTTDGGDTWTRLENGLPEGELGRIGLDVYRRDGNLVYAVVEAPEGRGVYRSTDRGQTWEMMSDRNPRPMYFSLIRIDPNNPDRIYLGGVQESASDDGGRTWWPGNSTDQIHSDHHALWINPHDSNHLIDGNDGGLAFSRDGSKTWRAITNMAIGQFYEIGVDMSEPYKVCGGLQDNGNWCAPHRTQSTWGPRNREWTHMWFGDGFYNKPDPTDPNIMYSESQGGNMARVDVATRESQSLRPVPRPTGDEAEDDEPRRYRFNWNSPIHISSHDPATVYLGGNHLMRTRDRGTTWEEASPDLTRAIDRDTMPIMGRVVTDETLSRNDGISTYGNITAFGESRHDPNTLYVGTDDGNLQITRDGGSTWTNAIDRFPGVPPRTYVSRIEPSYALDGRVYVTFDGHRNDDYAAYAFVSDDHGDSWRSITNGLPDGWSVNVIREDPKNPNLLFIGNEVGVFMSVDAGASWASFNNNLPTVAVDDIVIHSRDNDLVIGTHGRSIWILDDITPLQELSGQMLAQDAHLFGSRRGTMWSMGMDWPFQPAVFVADNPAVGVPIRYFLREPLDASATVTTDEMDSADNLVAAGPNAGDGANGDVARPAAEGLTLEILDSSGAVIRTLEPSNETGIQEVVWDFRIEPAFEAEGGGGGGFRGGAPPGAGPRVLPGTYTARLTVGEQSQTRDLEVRLDPRRDASRADLMARQDALMEIYQLQKPMREAGQRLQAMTERVNSVKQAIGDSELDEDGRSALEEAADELLEELREAGRELGRASQAGRAGAMQNWSGAPTTDQLWMIESTWEALPDAVARINELLTDRMPAFEDRITAAGLRPAVGDPIEVPRKP